MIADCASFILLALCLLLKDVTAAEPPIYSPDLAGRYCEARPLQCCTGRQDECSAPILGTVCYCDDFCNRTRNDDCCPDYWTFCKGLQIPELLVQRHCERNGRYYVDGDTAKINCNLCKCQEVNGQMEVLCENNVCLVDEELLERVNGNYRKYGWRATNYTEYWSRRYDEGLSHRLGTILSKKWSLQMSPINQLFDPDRLPRTFDARIKWAGIISKPKDQGWCGASWVFSTVAVASDRFAVVSYGNDRQFLSPQHLLSCNRRNQRGCQGGDLTRAWTFIRNFGLVPEMCYPWNGGVTECAIKRFKKQLETICPATQVGVGKADLHRVGPAYQIAGEHGIMYEILKFGPVQAVMKVWRDFFSYRSGIYRCSRQYANDRSAHHSVRIIGWGEENQNNQLVKYWIVSNSWGEWWGEKGYFRILRGSNECQIEEFIISAWANIENIDTIYQTIQAQKRANEVTSNHLR